jgi:hypothetical protein
MSPFGVINNLVFSQGFLNNMLLLQEVEKGCWPKFGVLIFNLALFIEHCS